MRLSALAWRGLAARPLRTALAVAGVALGVAIVVGTTIIGASSEQAIRGASADLMGSADVRLRAFADEGFGPRTLQGLRSTAGVAHAAPVSQRRMTVAIGADEQVVNVLVLGVDPDAESRMRPAPLVDGRALDAATPDGALVPASMADRLGLRIGDPIILSGHRIGADPLVIVGLLADRGFAVLDRDGVIVANRDALDASLEAPLPIRAIDLDLGDAPSADAIEAVTSTVREPFVAETADDIVARFASARDSFIGVSLLFALVSLIVGAFLIGNTLAMTVGERVRDIGLLRAAGTTSGQVLRIVLRQAAVLGVAGSLFGVAAGVVLAGAMVSFLSSTRAILLVGMPVPIGGLAAAVILGVVVTMLSALIPARRAARVSPLDALRQARRAGDGLLDRLRPVLVGELVAVAVALALVALGGTGTPLLPIALSLAMLVGGALATAFALEPLGRVIGRPFEWFFGAQGLLGRLNLSRDRVRTGLTVGAMMIALAAVVALGTIAESARAGSDRRVASLLPSGHAIRTTIPLDVDSYRGTFEATPGAGVVSPVLEAPVVRDTPDGPEEASVAGIDPNVFADGGALLIAGASRARAFDALRGGGAAFVPETLALRAGLRVGDRIGLALPGGDVHELTVAAILEASLLGRTPDGAIIVSSADARDLFGATMASLWVMEPQPGVTDAAFAASVRETADQLAAMPVVPRDLAGDLGRTLDTFGGLFDALAGVAVMIAALGLVNTLGVGVGERVREIAVLRSHGMTVGQVQAMVVAEATIMGAIAGVLAIVIGVLVAFTIVWGGISAELSAGVRPPWALLLAVLLGGTGIAALAGLYPARVAASLPIVRSLKHFE